VPSAAPPAATTSDRRVAATEASGRPLPTYKVHVYHDTGRALTLDGVTRPVLGYQTSFGYTVTHQGGLQGWRSSLDGAGLVELAPDWYRISVPDGGQVPLTTTIEAVEPPAVRWSLSLHLGAAVPSGSSATLHRAGLDAGLDVEARLASRWAVETILAFDQFPGKLGGADLRLAGLLVSGRFYLLTGAFQPFILAGVGAYALRPGSLQAGVHAGAGLSLELSPHLAVEAAARYQALPGTTPAFHFTTVEAGLRLRP
jgi:opacity protein-like surface antigen